MILTRIFLLQLIFYINSCVGGSSDPKPTTDSVGILDVSEDIFKPDDPPKKIEWSDGSTYSYDYTEKYSYTDSLGQEQVVTIYKRYQPEEPLSLCEVKICNWCNKRVYAYAYSMDEYPDLRFLSGDKSTSSMMGVLGGVIGTFFHGNTFFDLDNNRIRTEWRISCNYEGPQGFCSLRCERDYNNR